MDAQRQMAQLGLREEALKNQVSENKRPLCWQKAYQKTRIFSWEQNATNHCICTQVSHIMTKKKKTKPGIFRVACKG